MSIVICAVPFCSKMYLAADKRAIRNEKVEDNFQKIFELRKNVYYSITGIAEPGISYFNRLKQHSELTVDELINWCDKHFGNQPFPTLTIMISGKDEEGNFFIWQKNNVGEVTNADISSDGIAFSISSNKNTPLFSQFFTQQLISGNPVENAIVNTIEMASTIDDTISPDYHMVIIE